ncbi:T9SS type A sorting domain-containing protein [uncultured Tenacibaculum sp.]|uniref:PGAP1-like alpha/beta domain-containing protein n=1 Tax=uncultured Tenacibaculum sp. TaxID=174713 RepID=UPI0026138A7C|nr:T9SS type A sorting domain-containing protein [uncultured Tenacibaculum sp.]
MKRLILIVYLIVFASIKNNAQENPSVIEQNSDSFKKENLDRIFSNLGIRNVSTGFLIEKTIPLINFEDYDGINNSKVITEGAWNKIYEQALRSQITGVNKIIPLKESLKKFIATSPDYRFRVPSTQETITTLEKDIIDEKFIPISVIDISYNTIQRNAFESGMLYNQNGIIQQRFNSKPFEEKTLFAAQTMKQEIYQGNQINFRLNSAFYNTNINTINASYELDFGDGLGFRSVNLNMVQNISYSSIGVKTLTLKKINRSTQQIKIAKFSIHVKALRTSTPDKRIWLNTYIPSHYPHGSNFIGGVANVYSDNDEIENPIIICKGFDPLGEIKGAALYHLFNKRNFIEHLKSNGFDVIILDYNEGATYIERNAYLLKHLIERINQMKVTDNKLTVIGASMGGLIARYALAYMEEQNLNHDTKLYISFDAPHQGANVPIGLQYWLKFFSKIDKTAKDNYDNLLKSIASQQMLIYHSENKEYLNGNMFRVNFTRNLNSLGYPINLRKTAISNGSGNATEQSFSPKTQLINWRYRDFWTVDIDGNVWALPETSLNTVFYGNFQVSWLAEIFAGFDDMEQRVRVRNTKPYDSAPGGYINITQRIANNSTGGRGDITTNHPNHCFIPTKSALDLTGNNLYANLETTVTSHPFDQNYYPINKNEQHLHISNDFVNWINTELVPEIIVSNDQKRKGWNKGELRAQKKVLLKPGFKIQRGTTMQAYIEPLRTNLVRNVLVEEINENISFQNDYHSKNEIINKETVVLYPNPFSDVITIKTDEKIKSWSIYNLFNSSIQSGKEKVILANGIPQGMYTLHIVLNSGEVIKKTIVKN